MKSALKVIQTVFIVLAVLVGITLCGWFIWQVMPSNPYHDQWVWNLPPFPLALAVWFVGFPILIVFIIPAVLIGSLFVLLFKKITAAIKNSWRKRHPKKERTPK